MIQDASRGFPVGDERHHPHSGAASSATQNFNSENPLEQRSPVEFRGPPDRRVIRSRPYFRLSLLNGRKFRLRQGCHRWAQVCRGAEQKASRSAGAIRIAFDTRTWGSSPRSQSLYTVAVLTPSLAATSRTQSRWSAPTVILRKVGDKEGTNFLRISPFRCEGLDWVGPSVPRENEDLAAAANRWTLSGMGS